MKRAVVVLVSLALVAGCATVDRNYRPVVDMAGVDASAFERDLTQCRQYAQERLNAQQGAAAGAVAGAVLGVAFGAIFGLKGRDLTRMAGAGALGAGVGGAAHANEGQQAIIANCLVGRGYKVLAP